MNETESGIQYKIKQQIGYHKFVIEIITGKYVGIIFETTDIDVTIVDDTYLYSVDYIVTNMRNADGKIILYEVSALRQIVVDIVDDVYNKIIKQIKEV